MDRPAPTPFRMDPTNPAPRVRISQVSHPNYFCGSMPAVVGMMTDFGRIEKINEKSVVVSTGRMREILNITLAEAKRHGFAPPKAPKAKP